MAPLTLVIGPMRGGKTKRVLETIDEWLQNGVAADEIIAMRPTVDRREPVDVIKSRCPTSTPFSTRVVHHDDPGAKIVEIMGARVNLKIKKEESRSPSKSTAASSSSDSSENEEALETKVIK